jgi:hypothetical protein
MLHLIVIDLSLSPSSAGASVVLRAVGFRPAVRVTILNSMMAFQCARDGLYAMANECLLLLHRAH